MLFRLQGRITAFYELKTCLESSAKMNRNFAKSKNAELPIEATLNTSNRCAKRRFNTRIHIHRVLLLLKSSFPGKPASKLGRAIKNAIIV